MILTIASIISQVGINLINWVLTPETLTQIIIFLMFGVPRLFLMYRNSKETTVWNKAKEIAMIESQKAVDHLLKDDEATNRVIGAIYDVLPEKDRQFMTKEKAIEIANMVYHTYIKKNQDKVEQMALSKIEINTKE